MQLKLVLPQGVHELDKGNYEQATISCELGLEFAPRYADLWNNKGLISPGQMARHAASGDGMWGP
ncbi:hypothetical protein ACN28I_14480 [Archangium gephyra]|uniref:hypothetical protein n=1 Tax=Archangium gephyra TaxID=48 RepID=UPI003B7A14E4